MKRLPGFSKVTAREVYLSAEPPSRPEQQEVETSFFLGLKLRNGTFKTTRDRRMDDLNALVTSLLPHGRTLEILDTAVSSGITTLEWYEHLRSAGVPFHLSAGDLYCKAELRSWGRHFHLLADETGFVLQYETAGLAWRPWTSRIDWLLLYAVALHTTRLLFRFLQWRQAPRCHPLRLFSPRLLAVPDIELFEDDIFAVNDGFAQRFDVVRAANILNVVYFSKERLELAISRLAGRLKSGGLLIVNRTDFDDVNHGTVFRLTPARTFAVEARIGEGSEIEELVLSFGAGQEDAATERLASSR
jgi:hypothetical protein